MRWSWLRQSHSRSEQAETREPSPADRWAAVDPQTRELGEDVFRILADLLGAIVRESPEVERLALGLTVAVSVGRGTDRHAAPVATGKPRLEVLTAPGHPGQLTGFGKIVTRIPRGIELTAHLTPLVDDDPRLAPLDPLVYAEPPDAGSEAPGERSVVAERHQLPHAYREDRIMLTRLPPPRHLVRLVALVANTTPEPRYIVRCLDERYVDLSESDIVAPGDLRAALAVFLADREAAGALQRIHGVLRGSYVWLPLPDPAPAMPERTVFASLCERHTLQDPELVVLSSFEVAEATRPAHPDFWYVRLPLVGACQLAGDHGLILDQGQETAVRLAPEVVRTLLGAIVDPE